jgi:hypothetical protein
MFRETIYVLPRQVANAVNVVDVVDEVDVILPGLAWRSQIE